MLYFAVVCFVISLIAGVFGFGLVASSFAAVAKVLFFVFLVLLVVALLGRASGGYRATP